MSALYTKLDFPVVQPRPIRRGLLSPLHYLAPVAVPFPVGFAAATTVHVSSNNSRFAGYEECCLLP